MNGRSFSCVRKVHDGAKIPVASPAQIAEVADWLTKRVFSDGWRMLQGTTMREDAEKKNQTYQTFYEEQILAMKTFSRTLLASPNFHSLNLDNLDGAHKLVNYLVRLSGPA